MPKKNHSNVIQLEVPICKAESSAVAMKHGRGEAAGFTGHLGGPLEYLDQILTGNEGKK